jgi:integrase
MGLVKRGDVWWMSFMFEGRQVRRSTGTEDRRLAEAILGKIKCQIVEGRFFEKAKEEPRTFFEMMDRFATEHAPKQATYPRLLIYVRHLKGFFGNSPLDQVTPKRIVEYKNKRYADGVKPATINRELTTLKKAFNLARREWEWCSDNPVTRVSMEKENNARDRWLTRHEQARVLAPAAEWLRDIVIFAVNTGLRMGEILALTWGAVDFSRRTLMVLRSKNGERRTIPLNRTVLEILAKRMEIRPASTEHVFWSEAGTQLDGPNLRRAFRLILKKSGIVDFHFHDLRHTFATRMVQAGVDLYKVQRLLGHKSPQMTQRYAHHYPESLRDGVDALEVTGRVSTNLAQFVDSERSLSATC